MFVMIELSYILSQHLPLQVEVSLETLSNQWSHDHINRMLNISATFPPGSPQLHSFHGPHYSAENIFRTILKCQKAVIHLHIIQLKIYLELS